MRWHPNLLLPSPVDHDHECINWDNIERWAMERYVDTVTPGLLVHPTKGTFPNTRHQMSQLADTFQERCSQVEAMSQMNMKKLWARCCKKMCTHARYFSGDGAFKSLVHTNNGAQIV